MTTQTTSTPLAPTASPASRRSILFGIAAAAAAGPAVALPLLEAAPVPPADTPASGLAPAVATQSPDAAEPFQDAALVERVKEYLAINVELERLDQERARLHEAHWAKYPKPDALLERPGDDELLNVPVRRNTLGSLWVDHLRGAQWRRLVEIELPPGPMSLGTAVESFDPSPAARARADEIIAAYDDWHPKHNRDPRGVSKLNRQCESLLTKSHRLLNKIEKTRARTIFGVMAKAHVAKREAELCEGDESVSPSIVRDLVNLSDTYLPARWMALCARVQS